jgi:acyl-CoA synthetase (AMP-forming)/AMP-acid ligase II
VVAVVAPRAGVAGRPGDGELRDHCRATLAGYKVPKAFVWVDQVRRSPAGKPDYPWARTVAGPTASA